MKRFLTLAFALLIALPALAGDFPEEYRGERYNEWLEVSFQCQLMDHNAAWGSILDRDDIDVTFFGKIKMDGDVLTLNIEWIGRSDGYTPLEAGVWGKNKKFVWEEEEQHYNALVQIQPEVIGFEVLTVEGRGSSVQIWWRIGRLMWNRGGWPWWNVAAFPYDEWLCTEQSVALWRHGGARRKVITR
jgi:hypothetical protein